MRKAHDGANDKAAGLKRWADFCWWASIICAGVASFSGFFAMLPQVAHLLKIQPWMVSAVAGLGAVIQMVQKSANWRVKSTELDRHRKALHGLILRAEYETAPNDDGAIARLSQEFRQEKDRLSQSLLRIDNPGDDTKEGDTKP